MRIQKRYSGGVAETSAAPAKTKSTAPTPDSPRPAASTADSIRLSGRGLEVQRARGLALQAPDIRESLVGEVSGQIENGQYTVTGEDVAPKMIQEHLSEVAR